jgi:hypothetical protein
MLETHLAGKTTKKRQHFETPDPQASHSFSMSHYTEKQGGLPHCQTLAPNLLERCRPTGEQISSLWYPTANPGINQHSPLDSLTPTLGKKTEQKIKN